MRDFTAKEQNLYDNLITVINNVLGDSETTKRFLLVHVDELVEELIKNEEISDRDKA